jgi:cytoskeletal protein CcmA (bactofilin family)
MKKTLSLALFMCVITQVFAQTDGITYQAVILSQDAFELPGVDSQDNYLPNTTIAIRFTIYDSGNQLEFQEVQITNTDEFGRINLLIGDGDHDYFKEMNWDGTPKDLKVEIDFDAGSNFELMSRERLTFLPYAYHRNITATGTLTVDGRTFLNDELQVEGPTNLNSTLTVNNQNTTLLTGSLTVDGETNLNDAFYVNNESPSNLTGDLTVDGNTLLNGTLDVIGLTTLNDLQVNGEASFGDLTAERIFVTDSTNLDGGLNITSDSQVKLTSTLQGSDLDIKSYPLLVEGSNQGIAIKVNAVGAQNRNNFISFWDETPVGSVQPYDVGGITGPIEDLFEIVGLDTDFFPNLSNPASANTVSGVTLPDASGPMLWGRIEGETNENEFTSNADYNLDRLGVIYDLVDGSLDLAWQGIDTFKEAGDFTAALTSSTGCFGFGACVTAPVFSLIVNEGGDAIWQTLKLLSGVANEVFAIYMLTTFDENKIKFRGVSYASGAGDYAEYLERLDVNESMSYGDIVGLNGGKISKHTTASQKMMVISFKPAVLGALPQPNREQFYEKVAFMGQVPVKVFGKVNVGDYIIPSGNNDGLGIAKSPKDISAKDIKNIVGVAWESSENKLGFNIINVAVGINNNDNNPIVEKLESQALEQRREIDELKDLLVKTIERLDVIEKRPLSDVVVNTDNNSASEGENVGHDGRNFEVDNGIRYFEISDSDLEQSLKLVEKMMEGPEVTKSQKYIWKKIQEDPDFKRKLFKKVKDGLERQFHYHKEIIEEARN